MFVVVVVLKTGYIKWSSHIQENFNLSTVTYETFLCV